MKANERIDDYLDSLCPGNSAIIEQIRKQAVEERMPIIRRDGEALLKTLLVSKQPESILEIGTCVGYSAIIMASVCNAEITTIEIGEADYNKALANVDAAGYKDRIKCVHADATDVLKAMVAAGAKFDFVFMDAAKAQYAVWIEDIETIITKGGILLSDNVLLDGKTIESRFAIDRRDRTEHKRMRDYLYNITHSEKWQTAVITSADGMAISVRL